MALAGRAPRLKRDRAVEFALVDVGDTIVEVHAYAKQGAGLGYTGVRALNALLAPAPGAYGVWLRTHAVVLSWLLGRLVR